MALKRSYLILFFFTIFYAKSATNAVRYRIPAVVEIKTSKGGTCSGTIVGDAPLKVLTALHCIGSIQTGGVSILDPAVPLELSKESWIKSTKVYISQDHDFKLIAAEKFTLLLEIDEQNLLINEVGKKLGRLLTPNSPKGGFFDNFFSTPKIPNLKEQEELVNLMLNARIEIAKLEVKLSIAEETLGSKFIDHDMAVLVFDTRLPGNLSLEQRVSNREIIPLARENAQAQGIPVLIGGFGMTREDQGELEFLAMHSRFMSSKSSHFTTNELSVNPMRDTLYTLYGNTSKNLSKMSAPISTLGAPLKGDSGSAVLSEQGILAVTSSISFYSSHQPPAPNWINTLDASYDFIKRYEYIMAHFPSVTSPIAKAIFADVETTSGALLFADQVKDYSSIFRSEKLSVLELGKRQDKTKLFRLPADSVIISDMKP